MSLSTRPAALVTPIRVPILSNSSTMVKVKIVAKAKTAGMRVIPYTVDTKADAQKMVKAGVNAII